MIALLLATASATEVHHTVGWSTGFDARLGKGAATLGFGGGPSYRADIGEHWDAHGEARLLVLAGTVGVTRIGGGWHTTVGAWQPGIGVDLGVMWGASIRAITTENPALVPPVAPVIQARVDPLRFTSGRWSAEALRVEIGSGWDRGQPALAVGVTVMEVGIGF